MPPFRAAISSHVVRFRLKSPYRRLITAETVIVTSAIVVSGLNRVIDVADGVFDAEHQFVVGDVLERIEQVGFRCVKWIARERDQQVVSPIMQPPNGVTTLLRLRRNLGFLVQGDKLIFCNTGLPG